MNRLRVLLRLAWRDAARHKGRSLLIVALVALPVLVIGAADVLFRSNAETPEQQVAVELAGSSAYLWAPLGADAVQHGPTDTWPTQFPALPAGQRPDGTITIDYQNNAPGEPDWIDTENDPLRPADEVLELLPAGSIVTPWAKAELPVSADGVHYRNTTAEGVDLASPAAAGRYTLVAGTTATTDDEITLTRPLADRLGVGPGDRLWAGSPAREFRIVGLLDATAEGSRPAKAVVAASGAIPGDGGWFGSRYLVSSPQPITWDVVRELNSQGIQAYSRAVALDPPDPMGGTLDLDSAAMIGIAAAVLLIALAVMQVVFLSGPAFGIAARRMRRQLGLAAATGASPRQVAGVVLASGVLLGVFASVLGVTLGALIGVWIQPWVTEWTGIYFPGVQVRFGELALIAGIGAATSVVAAGWPALTALRTNPIEALTRRSRPPRRPGMISLAGLVVAAIGGIVVAVAATRGVPEGLDGSAVRDLAGGRAIWIGGGLVLAQLGLIVGTPQLIAGFAWLGRYLPTTARMALRSSARHRGRSTGAVATVLVASTGAVFGAVIVSTMAAQAAADYRPTLRPGLAAASSYLEPGSRPGVGADDLAEVFARLYPDAPVAGYSRLVHEGEVELIAVLPDHQQCPWYSPGNGMPWDGEQEFTEPPAADLPAARIDPRCVGMSFSTLTPEQAQASSFDFSGIPEIMIGDGELRQVLTGINDPDADRALASGEVVVLDHRYLQPDNTFQVMSRTWDDAGVRHDGPQRSAPAVLGRWAPGPVVAIVPPDAVAALGGVAGSIGFVADPGAAGIDRDLVSASGAALGIGLSVFVEEGPGSWIPSEFPSVWLILLIAVVLIIGVVLVVTALGVVDADDDSATYAAVGASAGLRRALSGWSALTTTGIGCLFGILAGLLAGWGVYRLMSTIDGRYLGADVPWGPMAILLFGVPLIAFALAAVFTRPRIQLIRRAE